ncbi:MAG TPA: FKBP-type peptidyl-prolyl cis-trans isomerase [Edaphobacter sp.]|nr:FKBP-type peptidyl-prolyl cis-trans isomerase [Edaphobacter sp.]
MISKFPSIALLAALTSGPLTTPVIAQTTAAKPAATAAKPASTSVHHTTAATTTTPPNIPKVVGIPKIVYALRYVDVVIGTGPLAETSVLGTSEADSKIKWYTVKYTGWLTDGTKFDSSDDHPGAEPITFPAGAHRVIPGWDTGFQGMHVGGKRRLFIPYQLAYGEAGRPPHIPAKSDLIFDIELVSISDTPPAPKAPPAPPANPTAAPDKPADAPAKPATEPAEPQTVPQSPPPPTDPTKPETTPHPPSL